MSTPESESTTPAAREAFYRGSDAGATALVVEDDLRSRIALTALLERGKLNVVAAENGQDALETLRTREGVDLVLMDILMPGMDGYDTIIEIRSESRFERLPIIAVTAKGNGDERRRCLTAGASDFVRKPIDSATLLTAIATCMTPPETGESPAEPS
jgi:CheY-like chemotaxis protein